MAWDRSEPSNTTKLRNLGTVIRPNWMTIEFADSTFQPQAINLTDRTIAGVSVNPTALSDAYINFCKTDSVGNSELFGIDESSNVIQYSYGGRLGGPTTTITFTNINFGTSTTSYTRNNFVLAYGRFTSNGTTVVANNCTIARISTGLYRVTLSPSPGNTNYVPVASIFDEGNDRTIKVGNFTNSTFDIRIANASNSVRDTGGMFHVCGGY